jgi:WD40 repeat protein
MLAKQIVPVVALMLTSMIMQAQDVFLTPYQGLKHPGKASVERLAFSADGTLLAAADSKGSVAVWNIKDNMVVKQWPITGGVLFLGFIDSDKILVAVSPSGNVIQYSTKDFTEARSGKITGKAKLVSIDPMGQVLTIFRADGLLELYDLRANLPHSQIRVQDSKKPLFVGYDRFGQQLSLITEFGKVATWNPLNQNFLRELNLMSGEYANSRSVIHAASTNSIGDRFVVSLQEVFIPKGGMQGRNQPERKNMIISYDWQTGNEVKRVPVRFRPDGMAFGPGPGHVSYYSKDALAVFMVNIERGEITSSVALTELASSLSISENGEFLGVGTEKGSINLYYIERNTPAEIKIHTPTLDRSYASQVVKQPKVQIEGSIEGNERITKLFVNEEPATLDGNKAFSGEVELVPGKNKVRVVAQNSENKSIVKDLYITYEPDKSKKGAAAVPLKPNGKRVALVIGNAAYKFTGKLNNTVNDANEIAVTLNQLGFDVIKITDGTYEQMKNAVYAFGDRIQDVDVSIFYYAGHGLEVDGTNYIVPVDADIQSALDVKQKALPLSGVLRTMEVTNEEGLNMIILDACRNNPFPTGKRGGSGLAKVTAPSGTLIAYATDPGSVASDGSGAHGLYTEQLIKQMKVSQRIEDVFMNTRNLVEDISKGTQRPWEEARLKGVFYLK